MDNEAKITYDATNCIHLGNVYCSHILLTFNHDKLTINKQELIKLEKYAVIKTFRRACTKLLHKDCDKQVGSGISE